MLNSRKNYTKETFVKEFLQSLIPWLIKRKEFIDWERILIHNKQYKNFIIDLENYKNLSDFQLKEKLADTILSLDNSLEFITYCFMLLWNTNEYYVSDQDSIVYKNLSKNITEKNAKQISEAIVEIWFKNILERTNINDYFIWLLVWFESDKRKNKWWTEFVNYIIPELEKLLIDFPNLSLKQEYNIKYWSWSDQNKRVDFAILDWEKCIIWIEINFYTNSWSKPTEIKRSYWEVNRKLNELWIQLVWITDWFWYTKMRKSLWDAFEIHPNIYNVSMLRKDFKEDLKNFITKQ